MGDIDFSPLMVLAFIGLIVVFMTGGALVGALIVAPFALWRHSLALFPGPMSAGAGLAGAVAVALLFGHRR